MSQRDGLDGESLPKPLSLPLCSLGLMLTGVPGAFWKVLGVKTFLIGAGSHRPPQGGYYTFNHVGKRQPAAYLPPTRVAMSKRWHEVGMDGVDGADVDDDSNSKGSSVGPAWRLHTNEKFEYDLVWHISGTGSNSELRV